MTFAGPANTAPDNTEVPPTTEAHPARRSRRGRWGPAIVGGAVAAAVAIGINVVRGPEELPAVTSWTAFVDPEGRFSLDLPKAPERTTQTQQTEIGALETIQYQAEYRDAAVGAGYADYPADIDLGDPDTVLAGAAEGAASAVQGEVVSQTPLTVAGRPAADVEIQREDGRVLSRLILDGQRLYFLTTVGRQALRDEHEQLVNSFTLTDPGG